MMLHKEKLDDKGEKRAYRQMGRKMVPKQMGRFLGNSLTDLCLLSDVSRDFLAECSGIIRSIFGIGNFRCFVY